MFHMDLGYICGLDNLPEVVIGDPAGPLLTKSIDGHVAYLLVIDAATRYIWNFPLLDEHPPLTLIDQFLCRFGNPQRHCTKQH